MGKLPPRRVQWPIESTTVSPLQTDTRDEPCHSKIPPIPIETRGAERATESLADLKTGGKVRGRVVMTH